MKNKKSIIIGITSLTLVTLILLGLTYAYYRTRIIGNESTDPSISVTSKKLELTYEDGDATVNMTGKISPGFVYTKNFTVKDTGDGTAMDFAVYLENVINEFERPEDWTYSLTCTSLTQFGNEGSCVIYSETDGIFPQGESVLVSANIGGNLTYNFTLEIRYNNLESTDQSVDMGKTLSAKINIRDKDSNNPYAGNKNTLAYNILANSMVATNGTDYRENPITEIGKEVGDTFYKDSTNRMTENVAIPNAYNIIVYADDYTVDSETGKFYLDPATTNWVMYGTGQTLLNGKYIANYDGYSSTSDFDINAAYDQLYYVTNGDYEYNNTNYIKFEQLRVSSDSIDNTLSITQDDLGDSYYFRGNPKDNYVNFNNMCWRIVRIEGDGAVKLLLADAENTCDSTNYSSSNKSSNFGPIDLGYKTENGATMFDYKNATTGAKNTLTTWFNDNFTNVKGDIKSDTTWCLGNLTDLYAHKDPFTQFTQTKAELINASTRYYYEKRLSLSPEKGTNNNMFNPTLLCKNNNDEYDSNYVGILSADELVFAGAVEDKIVKAIYTRDNSNSLVFTSTVVGYYTSGKYEAAYLSGFDNSLSTGAINRTDTYIRPVISLIAGTEITDGDGTQSKPYVIKEG